MKFVFVFILLNSLFLHLTSSLPTIGVTYSVPVTPVTQPLAKISKFTHVRILGSNPSLFKSLSGNSWLLTIPNDMLPSMADDRSVALKWIYNSVPPQANISIISVGNAISESRNQRFWPFLLPAVNNIHHSLKELGLEIPVSTTYSFLSMITTAFPPSSAQFQQPAGKLILKPMLRFLEENNSSFLINLYPYDLFRQSKQVPLGFALFLEDHFNFIEDKVSNKRYFNLFDMMVDAVITAMARAGYKNIPIIVTETGWPSAGDPGELEADRGYAELYLKGLVWHLMSGAGTPLRKGGVTELYVYELVDGAASKKWGVLYDNFTEKYEIDFSDSPSLRKHHQAFQWINFSMIVPPYPVSYRPPFFALSGISSGSRLPASFGRYSNPQEYYDLEAGEGPIYRAPAASRQPPHLPLHAASRRDPPDDPNPDDEDATPSPRRPKKKGFFDYLAAFFKWLAAVKQFLGQWVENSFTVSSMWGVFKMMLGVYEICRFVLWLFGRFMYLGPRLSLIVVSLVVLVFLGYRRAMLG